MAGVTMNGKNHSSSTKENNGRGARRLLWKKLSVVACCFGTIWAILLVVWGIPRYSSTTMEGGGGRRAAVASRPSSIVVDRTDSNSGSSNNNQHSILSKMQQKLRRSAQHGGGGAHLPHERHARHNHHHRNEEEEQNNNNNNNHAISPAAELGITQIQLDAILNANVHLIDLHVDEEELHEALESAEEEGEEEENADSSETRSYDGVYATFCKLDWSVHKKDPSSYPMFRDVMAASKGCAEPHRIHRVNLKEIVEMARKYDTSQQANNNDVKVLNITGVVFHESRCGSTLAANLLVAVDPTAHRVYSESTPPIQALRSVCGENYQQCPIRIAAQVLRDVMYLMSRSDDMNEERVFFKIQSAGSRNLPVFTTAFPTTPYLFVYREPVQVMMSHLKQGIHSANCIRERRSPPASVIAAVTKYTPHLSAQRLHPEDYCAAHLASITETVVQHLTVPLGIPINYANLTDVLYYDILPQWVGQTELTPSQLQQVQATSSVYSKNRGGKRVTGEFHSDSQRKEEQASDAVRDAAQTYLLPSYIKLERIALDQQQQRQQRQRRQ